MPLSTYPNKTIMTKNDTVETINPASNGNDKKYNIKNVPATERTSRSGLENNSFKGVLSFINNRVKIVYMIIRLVIARYAPMNWNF